jgi:hypothetical protein
MCLSMCCCYTTHALNKKFQTLQCFMVYKYFRNRTQCRVGPVAGTRSGRSYTEGLGSASVVGQQ